MDNVVQSRTGAQCVNMAEGPSRDLVLPPWARPVTITSITGIFIYKGFESRIRSLMVHRFYVVDDWTSIVRTPSFGFEYSVDEIFRQTRISPCKIPACVFYEQHRLFR